MKKIISSSFIIITLILITACSPLHLTPKEAVRDYLESYITLDSRILNQLDEYIASEPLTASQKELYKNILKKQYTSLNYTFINEIHENNLAYITTKITVLDYLKVQNEATIYLAENHELFENSEGDYDNTKFIDYKLDQMNKVTDTTEYEIEFKVTKNNKVWDVAQLSNDDLEKIHGIYEN